MARRRYKKRTYKRRNTSRKATRSKASTIDMTVVGLIVLSILLSVLIYGRSGTIGIKLNEILGGMMGFIRYVLPIGIFAVAIKIATDDDEYITSKLAQYTILLVSFAVLMSVYQISKDELYISNRDISYIAKDAYNLGTAGSGGGVLGAILATPLVNLLGEVGATILCIGVVAMLAVFTFGINMSEIINDLMERVQEKRETKSLMENSTH